MAGLRMKVDQHYSKSLRTKVLRRHARVLRYSYFDELIAVYVYSLEAGQHS